MLLPILMLHQVENYSQQYRSDWSISEEQFSLLLDCIEESKLTTTTFAAIESHPKESLSKKVIITFDDCAAVLFDFAIPALIKRNMKAVFYIPTAQIGGYNEWDVSANQFAKIPLMTAEQLQYLADKGMEIGSHGHQHLNAKHINRQILMQEIQQSKEKLETLLQKPIYSFSFPYGEATAEGQKEIAKAGYRYGLSIYQAFQNRFALRRIGIHQNDNQKSLMRKLTFRYQLMRSIFDPLKALLRK